MFLYFLRLRLGQKYDPYIWKLNVKANGESVRIQPDSITWKDSCKSTGCIVGYIEFTEYSMSICPLLNQRWSTNQAHNFIKCASDVNYMDYGQ